MEAWLAELEIKMDSAPTFINNLCHQKETMELSFEEQIAATLGEDLSYFMCAENNTTSPQQWDFDCDVMEHINSASQFFSNNCNQNDVIINDIVNNNENDNRSNSNSNSNSNNDNENDNINIVSSNCNVQERQQQLRCEEGTKKQGGGTKRKRHPIQVQDHIIAERRRRELLSQMFISLSAIVPGLKKVDKTSVLGEAIKYMKQLQEKVKVLEEVATKRRVVVVKNTHVMNNDDIDSSSTVDDDRSGSGGSGGSISETNNYNDSLPEIEVKISGKTLLLRVSCEDQKGILTKLFGELDKHDISVTSCSVVPFDTLALDITIVAQVKERDFNDNVEGFIRSLRSALRLNC